MSEHDRMIPAEKVRELREKVERLVAWHDEESVRATTPGVPREHDGAARALRAIRPDMDALLATAQRREQTTRSTRLYRCGRCHHESTVSAETHAVRGCDRTNCDGTQSPMPDPPASPSGVAMIATERQRQVSAEGWTPAHDDGHDDAEMPLAARCYIEHSWQPRRTRVPKDWPWDGYWWKPGDPVRDLVKAGALIAAEIDRLLRAAPACPPREGEER